MKQMIIAALTFLLPYITFSQKIVNLVLAGDNGITADIKKAHSLMLVKKYPGYFQRLDYKIGAPLQKLRSYSDSAMTILDGTYLEYAANGYAFKRGYYAKNLKEKEWYTYNETGKLVLTEKYEKGILISSEKTDPDKEEEGEDEDAGPGEAEAIFKKGDTDWIKYITKHLNGEVSTKSVKGGNVIVQFVVNTTGKVVDVDLHKSVEFILDEEAIRVIEASPLWQPAMQEGKRVNAYRLQPITFQKN
jgi:protein TonB